MMMSETEMTWGRSAIRVSLCLSGTSFSSSSTIPIAFMPWKSCRRSARATQLSLQLNFNALVFPYNHASTSQARETSPWLTSKPIVIHEPNRSIHSLHASPNVLAQSRPFRFRRVLSMSSFHLSPCTRTADLEMACRARVDLASQLLCYVQSSGSERQRRLSSVRRSSLVR